MQFTFCYIYQPYICSINLAPRSSVHSQRQLMSDIWRIESLQACQNLGGFLKFPKYIFVFVTSVRKKERNRQIGGDKVVLKQLFFLVVDFPLYHEKNKVILFKANVLSVWKQT